VCKPYISWIDQRHSDFGKSRSLSIRAAKNALEETGFTLPEPIYRLRFDAGAQPLEQAVPGSQGAPPDTQSSRRTTEETSAVRTADLKPTDVKPETHVADKVRDERVETEEQDLLDENRPIE
jgi:hypothetical protein